MSGTSYLQSYGGFRVFLESEHCCASEGKVDEFVGLARPEENDRVENRDEQEYTPNQWCRAPKVGKFTAVKIADRVGEDNRHHEDANPPSKRQRRIRHPEMWLTETQTGD